MRKTRASADHLPRANKAEGGAGAIGAVVAKASGADISIRGLGPKGVNWNTLVKVVATYQ